MLIEYDNGAEDQLLSDCTAILYKTHYVSVPRTLCASKKSCSLVHLEAFVWSPFKDSNLAGSIWSIHSQIPSSRCVDPKFYPLIQSA